jgi:hypothetical protein
MNTSVRPLALFAAMLWGLHEWVALWRARWARPER